VAECWVERRAGADRLRRRSLQKKEEGKEKYAACSRKAPASEAAATQAVPDLLLFEFDLAYAAFYGQVQGVGGFAVGRVYVLAVFFLQAVNIDRA
jgi:hypothetical protein